MVANKPVILVVDDDRDVRDVISLVLRQEGYEVVQASSAEEALHAYKEKQPRLLIVDLMMEEVDSGASLVKELKALGNTAPIFMLSSVGDSLYATTSYADMGLAGVFQKPIDPTTLKTTVKNKLG